MKRKSVDSRWTHHLDINYWNDGYKPTWAREVQISPMKTLWVNCENGKEKELSHNKLYKAIEVFHLVNNDRYNRKEFDHKKFSRYVLLNERGEIIEYYERGIFINKQKRLDNVLNELFDIK